ncbi:MAG: hypothetical protein JSV44_03555 [Candidatus Zixiibacteriota bacterium]|nr:MAG: hypothetical protein JSV44_03555 [candidate division Zixibacteria bacterium]
MKQSKLLILLIAALVLIFVAPASGLHYPIKNHIGTDEMREDHPWGGDEDHPGDDPIRQGGAVDFYSTSFFLIDIIEIIIGGDFVFDRNTDAGNEDNSDQTTLPDSVSPTNNSNRGLPQRGN